MSDIKTTAAIERGAEAILNLIFPSRQEQARAAISAAFDIEEVAQAIHDGPNAQVQYRKAGIAPHSYAECPYKDQYRADANAVSAALLGPTDA